MVVPPGNIQGFEYHFCNCRIDCLAHLGEAIALGFLWIRKSNANGRSLLIKGPECAARVLFIITKDSQAKNRKLAKAALQIFEPKAGLACPIGGL